MPGIVSLHVKGARNLAGKQSDGTSNPYCTIRLLDPTGSAFVREKKQKTKTIKRQLNPVWDEKFELGNQCNLQEAGGGDIEICLFDYQLHKKTPLGRVLISLEGLTEMPTDEWYSLEHAETKEYKTPTLAAKDAVSGELHVLVSVKGMDPKAGLSSAQQHRLGQMSKLAEPNMLEVRIMEATGLPAMDRGSCDPLVRMIHGRYKRETRYLTRTTDPAWRETFKYKLDFQQKHTEVLFVVEDWNRATPNEFVAKCSVKLMDLAYNGEEETDLWYPLIDKVRTL